MPERQDTPPQAPASRDAGERSARSERRASAAPLRDRDGPSGAPSGASASPVLAAHGAGRTYFQALFESERLLLWLLTPDGVVAEANGAALARIRAERDEVVWRPFWESLWWRDDDARAALRHAIGLALHGETSWVTVLAERSGADPQPLELTVRPNLDPLGQVTALIVEGFDPSARLAAEARFERLAEDLDDAVVLLSPALVPLHVNAAAQRLLRLPAPRPEGRPPLPLPRHAPAIDETHLPIPGHEHPAAVAVATGEAQRGRVLGMVFETATEWLRVSALPLDDGCVLLRARALQGSGGRFGGTQDDLTRLPSRSAFFDRLGAAAAGRESYGVLHIDVDDFRHINDQIGHGRADTFLRRFAATLQRCLRPGDFVARLAGDEFAVLLPGLSSESGAVKAAARILQRLRTPIAVDDEVVVASASLGIAIGQPGEDPELVLRNADFALRHAKHSGRDRYAIYDEALSLELADETQLLSDLKSALERDQLDVAYQPLVDAKDRRVIGAEALMRWRHPTKGDIPPARFIPLAERSGLIVSMELWLLEVALAQLKAWNARRPDFRLSINLSARQLEQKGFFSTFEGALRSSGVTPANLQVEVTETYAMQRPDEKGNLLRALAELGVVLAIDDFGTGYSNLGHLQHLPFAVIKIDRSFMRDVPTDPRNFALVRTIIAMAQSLDLAIIAEGVETRPQADFLFWEGAGTLQGFLFGRPIDAQTFEASFIDIDPD